MIDDSYLDMASDFEVLYSPIENEKAISAWQYAMDQIADHWSSYQE